MLGIPPKGIDGNAGTYARQENYSIQNRNRELA